MAKSKRKPTNTISEETAEKIVDVLLKYVSPQIASKMTYDLAHLVDGNKAYRATMLRVKVLAARRADGVGV